MQGKYKNVKKEFDGIKFDSTLEKNIYIKIKELNIPYELQPKFNLLEKFKFEDRTIRAIVYVADFKLTINNKEYIIDAKGLETPVFKIKRKLFMNKYNQDIVTIKSVKNFTTWYDEVSKLC